MESRHIPDSAVTASSQIGAAWGPENARLHFQGAPGHVGGWRPFIPPSLDSSKWLQVDFGTETQVTGVATQGYHAANYWVTTFTLSYRGTGSSYFKQYQPDGYTKV